MHVLVEVVVEARSAAATSTLPCSLLLVLLPLILVFAVLRVDALLTQALLVQLAVVRRFPARRGLPHAVSVIICWPIWTLLLLSGPPPRVPARIARVFLPVVLFASFSAPAVTASALVGTAGLAEVRRPPVSFVVYRFNRSGAP